MNVGFGNQVPAADVRMILDPLTYGQRHPSAPVRRLREQAEREGRLADATQGRKTRAVVVLDTNQVILSAVAPETLMLRLAEERRRERAELQGKEAGRD